MCMTCISIPAPACRPSPRSGPRCWGNTAAWACREKADFDATAWKEGPGGFGEKSTPGTTVRTDWKTADIWLRRTFELPASKHEGLHFAIHHDEDAEIYLNGVLAARTSGYITD